MQGLRKYKCKEKTTMCYDDDMQTTTTELVHTIYYNYYITITYNYIRIT